MGTLVGGVNPGGTITFFFSSRRRHTRCGRDWSSDVCSSDLTVTGNGTYPSSAVTVTRAGRYRWIASYSGDPNNNAVSTSCGDAGETSTVNKATPARTTTPLDTTTARHTIQDMSSLAGGVNPGGTITFTLYGPFDPTADPGTCTNGTAAGFFFNDTATTEIYTLSLHDALPIYRWIASYSGDPNNNAVSTSCGDAGETSTVNKATPTLTTSATATATADRTSTRLDTRHVRMTPAGTSIFTLYGPFDPTADPRTC